jgi:hypothetical protein
MLAIVQNVAAGFGILNLSVFFLLTGPRQNNQEGPIERKELDP